MNNQDDNLFSITGRHDYIKVVTPNVYLVLGAMLVLCLSIYAWGVWGRIETLTSAQGVAVGGEITCYLSKEEVSKVEPGQEVRFDDPAIKGVVTYSARSPVSEAEAEKDMDAHTHFVLDPQAWSYPVVIRAEGIPDGLCSVRILVESVSPLSFVIN